MNTKNPKLKEIEAMGFTGENTSPIIIGYVHKYCPDGLCSGAVIKMKYPNAIIIDISAGFKQFDEESRDVTYDSETIVIFADLCPPENIIRMISKSVKEIIIYDHHDTGEEVYDKICDGKIRINDTPVKMTYDKDDRAGCLITWNELFPNNPPPKGVLYVSDRDTWAWKLPDSREISAAMWDLSYSKNIGLMTELINMTDEDFDKFAIGTLIPAGEKILEEIRKYVAEKMKSAFSFKMRKSLGSNEYYEDVVTCNSDCIKLRSEIGHELMNNFYLMEDDSPDFALMWGYNFEKNTWKISMRSNEHGLDVSKIAENYGGGGHRDAASFILYGNKGESLNSLMIRDD